MNVDIKTRMLEAVRDSDIETVLSALASVCQDIAFARQLETSQDSLPPLSAYRWKKLAETLKQIQIGTLDLK